MQKCECDVKIWHLSRVISLPHRMLSNHTYEDCQIKCPAIKVHVCPDQGWSDIGIKSVAFDQGVHIWVASISPIFEMNFLQLLSDLPSQFILSMNKIPFAHMSILPHNWLLRWRNGLREIWIWGEMYFFTRGIILKVGNWNQPYTSA